MDITNLCLGCMEEKGAAKTCPFCGYEEGAAPESLLHLPPGFVLQDKYLLGRVLGQGGFGITYIAWDNILNIKLAIKEYLPQQLATRTGGEATVTVFKPSLSTEFSYGLSKFLDEARTLARFIEHPNIVSVRDYFEANGTAYLVMNCHEGVTLQNYLASKGGIIPVEQALAIFMPVLDALKEVHAAGILHRDVSPDNLLIDKNGRVILIDFGAARQAMSEKSKSLSVIMKAGFSPPEQYQSRGKQGPWTDIYAVAASLYRTITGQAPLEAIDRMVEDDLITPSELGVIIEPAKEKALFKALAVKAKDRYQAVNEFQRELVASSGKGQTVEGYAGVRPKTPVGAVKVETKRNKEGVKEKSQADIRVEAAGAPEKKPGAAKQPASKTNFPSEVGRVLKQSGIDYYIDYQSGNINVYDLPIGARLVDPTWKWHYRTGDNYSNGGELEEVVWILVAKNHYEQLEPHVTLLTENLICKHEYNFPNRTKMFLNTPINMINYFFSPYSNYWGDCILRDWLNSINCREGSGFFSAFSDSFRESVIQTMIPNKGWDGVYYTQDRVFIPSITELGAEKHSNTYEIGRVYQYFAECSDVKEGNNKRIAMLEDKPGWYWSRSPFSLSEFGVRSIFPHGKFVLSFPYLHGKGVRAALNLKANTLISQAALNSY